jgi:hypothetical protein
MVVNQGVPPGGNENGIGVILKFIFNMFVVGLSAG